MVGHGRARSLALLLTAAGLLIACKDDVVVPATQVIVTVNSDLEVGEQLTSVEVRVLDPDDGDLVEKRSFELTAGEPRAAEVRLPFSFGIVKGGQDRFRLDVVGYGPVGAGGAVKAVVEQKLVASFQPRRTLLIKVFLGEICFENLCEGELTCYPEADGRTAGGKCGAVLEPILEPVRAGEEDDVWTATGMPDGGTDGGVSDAGPDAGPSPSAGRGGSAGRGAAGTDGGSAGSGEAGSGAAGEEGGAGETAGAGAGAGEGGSGGDGAAGSSGECEFGEHGPHTISLQSTHNNTPMLASAYPTSPPSFGPHCDAYGDYTVFNEDKPLGHCNFIHNLEHGAIVFLYNCPDNSCPEVVQGFKDLMRDTESDPLCTNGQKRLLLTPYDQMDATFAASAWGYTWTSNCAVFDAAVRADLVAFIEAHRGKAPEPTQCVPGVIVPEP